MTTYGISEFSELTGLPVHTLRRLHASGALTPVCVTEGGHRRYDEGQIDVAKQLAHKHGSKVLPVGECVIDEDVCYEPFLCYLLGLSMAKGKANRDGRVEIVLDDKQHAQWVMKHFETCSNVSGGIDGSGPYTILVPPYMSSNLVEFGMTRKRSWGCEIPQMSSNSFRRFLCGFFDGCGGVVERKRRLVLRFYGHPRTLGYVQNTLLAYLDAYMTWVRDKRKKTGMLETSSRTKILRIFQYMTEGGDAFVTAKRERLKKLISKEN